MPLTRDDVSRAAPVRVALLCPALSGCASAGSGNGGTGEVATIAGTATPEGSIGAGVQQQGVMPRIVNAR
jgi:hypothetical protein